MANFCVNASDIVPMVPFIPANQTAQTVIIWAIVLVVLLGIVGALGAVVIKTRVAMKNTKVKARLDDVWYHERMGKLRDVQ